MKKLTLCLLLLSLLLSLTACGQEAVDEKALFDSVNTLIGDYSSDSLTYEAVLTASDKQLSLRNSGTLRYDSESSSYTYTYRNEHLNQIGSGAEALISADSGTITGTKEALLAEGISVTDGVSISPLVLQDSFKTYRFTREGSDYVMSGYIARNTILRFTPGLDDDIRFNYRLTVNEDITELKALEISYVTNNFDSVVITILFGEAQQ